MKLAVINILFEQNTRTQLLFNGSPLADDTTVVQLSRSDHHATRQ